MAWTVFSGYIAGDDPACGQCTSCKHYEFKSGNSKPHLCKDGSSTNNYAHRLADNRADGNPCCSYAKAKGKSKSGKGGKKRPLWLKILCCPCACLRCIGLGPAMGG